MQKNVEVQQRLLERDCNTTSEVLLPEGCDSALISHGSTLCVWRFSKPTQKMLPILREYDGIGFSSKYAGGLHVRTPSEQEQFIRRCLDDGLPVVPSFGKHAEEGSDGLVFPYVHGVPLSRYLAKESNEQKLRKIIEINLQDLQLAHSKHIVYGDRWGPNDIVTFDDRIARIDLDFELLGPKAADFELAQAVYHTVFFAKERANMIVSMVREALQQEGIWDVHNREVFQDLLHGHYKFFQGTEYACSEIQAIC